MHNFWTAWPSKGVLDISGQGLRGSTPAALSGAAEMA